MWDMISAVSGVVTLFIMLFIEWPRILERWRESFNVIKTLFSLLYLICLIFSFILLQIGLWPGNQLPIGDDVWGQVGLWSYNALLLFWVLSKLKLFSKDFVVWITFFGILLLQFVIIYMYYFP